jgi:hypothetical protein
MMAVVQTAMLGGLPYTALRDAIFTHPTAAEGLIGLFSNLPSAPRQDSHVSNRIEPRRRQATAVPVSAGARNDADGLRHGSIPRLQGQDL